MRPTPHRIGTVLLTVLLVTSLAAPIAAGSVAAQDGGDDDASLGYACDSRTNYVMGVSCTDWSTADDVSTDETIMHSMAVSESESLDSHYVSLDNTLEDTSTIASLEARNAVASAWENGSSSTQAYQDGMDAIRDYYAIHQINHIEVQSKAMTQFGHIHNATERDDEISHGFIASGYDESVSFSATTVPIDESVEWEEDLVNGSTHNFTAPILESQSSGLDNNFVYHHPAHMPEWNDGSLSDEDVHEVVSSPTSTRNVDLGTAFATRNVGDVDDGGLPSTVVFDPDDWMDRWTEIQEQSDEVVSNYDQEFVDDLYHELDEGNIEPEDIRGAEGQIRFLSGDDDVTGDRFQLAMMQVLGMSNPDMSSTSSMTVEYEGYTGIEYNGTDGESRVAEFSDHVDNEYQGLVFASDVPDGGFEVNETYTTTDVEPTETDHEVVNGSVQMFDSSSGETIRFESGNFTITEMVDGDGEQVNQTDWERPEYDTYNASDFAEYIEEVQDLQDQIEEASGEDDDAGLTLPGVPDLDETIDEYGGVMIGLVIILAVVMVVVGIVTDLLPWT